MLNRILKNLHQFKHVIFNKHCRNIIKRHQIKIETVADVDLSALSRSFVNQHNSLHICSDMNCTSVLLSASKSD